MHELNYITIHTIDEIVFVFVFLKQIVLKYISIYIMKLCFHHLNWKSEIIFSNNFIYIYIYIVTWSHERYFHNHMRRFSLLLAILSPCSLLFNQVFPD